MPEITPVQIRFQNDELAAIDRYRREQLNPPSRPRAARELIRHALSYRDGQAGEAPAGAAA